MQRERSICIRNLIGVKRVVFEEVCLVYGFFLNIFGKVFEEFIEGGGGRNIHLFAFDKL